MAIEQECLGEIIESSTTEFLAESRELHAPPRFGSFVKVPLAVETGIEPPRPAEPSEGDPFADSFRTAEGSFSARFEAAIDGKPPERSHSTLAPAIYAVVHQASTTSAEPGRRPRAYWKDEQQLREEQPELSEWLLVTDFRAIIIGYCESGYLHQYLPPHPPKIHSFVCPCTPEEVELLTSRMDFLRTLADFRAAPSDEVIAACIREACAARANDREFLVAAGKELANLLKDDYDRLKAIMRRVAP